jgi:hypothetical protein
MHKINSFGSRITEDRGRSVKYPTVVLGCWRLSRKELLDFQGREILGVGLVGEFRSKSCFKPPCFSF